MFIALRSCKHPAVWRVYNADISVKTKIYVIIATCLTKTILCTVYVLSLPLYNAIIIPDDVSQGYKTFMTLQLLKIL